MLNLKKKEECAFDAVSLGEIMLRLDPGEGRIRTAREFRVWEGGGEYNVMRGLRKCFGLKTAAITAFADNEVGKLLLDLIMQGGVDTSLIKLMPTDGIGRVNRNGLNFTERGFGIRGAVGCSDRANTAISKATAADFDFDYIFGELGVRLLHTGGIYASLSKEASETVIEAIKCAKKYGTIVSYDLNYRPSMWNAIGGIERAREVNKEIAKYVDIMIGNEEDFTACLGYNIEGNDAGFNNLNVEGYEKMLREAIKDYPNFKYIATTLRTVKSASKNDWSAILFSGGNLYKSKEYKDLDILDRVGGGDSFASGLIYGLMMGYDAENALNYGVAHGALAMTTPGDTSMADLKEVEALINGTGARIKR
ncbi:MAG: sugar kinase [Lachnospiraceae bacterium]|nr:sugar kinase [Lachnospiraceae bacterium]